jgi:hypothetical protein
LTQTPQNSAYSFRESKKDLLYLVLVCLAAFFLILPVWLNGVPKGNDLPQHFQFAVTIHDSLQAGEIYPPVPYYALAIGKMLAGNWFDAACLIFWFWLALSGAGAYLWARERFGPGGSFVGALIYVAAPYHINELYNAFTYAEFAAVAVLPFCFLFVDRLVREARLFNFLGLGAAFSLLVMCNLPIAVMGTLSLGGYTLVSLPRKSFLPVAIRTGAAFIFGAALCAFFWIKIVTEMAWLNHSAEGFSTASTFYDYKVNFLLMFRYLAALNFDDRDMWFADLVLLATLCLFIPLVIVFWAASSGARSFASQRLGRVMILFLFGLFMATPLSAPIWDNISTIQKIQFPWRWMAIVTLSGVPMAAAGWSYFTGWLKTNKRPYALIVFGCMLFGVVFTYSQIIKQATYHTRGEFETLVETLGEAQNFDCWFTVWAKEEALKTSQAFIAPGRNVSSLTWTRDARYFHFSKGEAVRARVATFYYPYWRVWVNDVPAQAFPAEDGSLSFDLPPEAVTATARFEEPMMIVAARIFSLLCWIITGILAISLAVHRLVQRPQPVSSN